MAFEEQRISEYRREIDKLDQQILDSLNRRAGIVAEIRQLKAQAKLPILDPQREQEILTKLSLVNQGPLRDQDLHDIYRQVLHSMRNFE